MTNKTASVATPEKVARLATQNIQMDPAGAMLIGVFGPEEALSALVRLPGGRIRRLARGTRFQGGQVAGVDAGGVSLVKGAKTRRLTLPGASD